MLMAASVMMDVAMVMGVSMETGMLNSLILQLFLFMETTQLLQQLGNKSLSPTSAGLQKNL